LQLKVVGTAVALAVLGGATVLAHADDPGAHSAQKVSRGLSMSPVKIDQRVAAGATNAITVANNSDKPLDIAVTARPWTQSSSGRVVPNRRATISAMTVSDRTFALAPGASKTVNVALTTAPSSGSLYGALEVIGLPQDLAKREGVVTGYRLVGAIRFNPAAPVYNLTAGAAKVTGDPKMLALTVRNTGNTVEPVSGSVRVKGATGTRQGSVKATRILPGKSIALPLVSAGGMSAGSYTATVSLKQGTFKTTLTKRIKVRR
jgi:P pilus assembly chaperone PapD